MIFQQVYGFGKVTATIKGAPGETVTYTGAESGSVALDSNGVATVTLKCGDYALTGSKSAYTANCRLRPNATEMAVYPEGYIYWYGRVREGLAVKTKLKDAEDFTNRSATARTNDLRLSASARTYSGTRYNTWATVYFSGVDTTGYSTLHFTISDLDNAASGTNKRTIGQSNSTTGEFDHEISSVKSYSYSINSKSYIGARQAVTSPNSTGTTSYYGFQMSVAAIWMEAGE